MTSRWKWILSGTAAIALVIYGLFDPAEGYFPRCIIKTITGYDCPGCGSQRAIHALLNGDIIAAWHHNALMMLTIPFVALLVTTRLYATRLPRLFTALRSTVAAYTITIIVLAWWIGRNLI